MTYSLSIKRSQRLGLNGQPVQKRNAVVSPCRNMKSSLLVTLLFLCLLSAIRQQEKAERKLSQR